MPHASQRANVPPSDNHILRLFSGDDRGKWKLRMFFDAWFRPEFLEGEKQAPQGTIDSYLESILWWEKLTDNPSLDSITRETLKEFRGKLREATYTRSPLKTAKRYHLAEATQLRHLQNIRAIIHRTGPETDNRRETAAIVDKAAHIAIPKLEGDPKPAFTLQQARMMAAACQYMKQPRIEGVDTAKWNYAILCGFAFTGLRRNSCLRLKWSSVEMRKGQPWLRLERVDIDKTGKATRIRIHPEMWAAINAIKTDSEYLFSIDKYLSRPRRRGGKRPRLRGDRVRDLLYELQTLAGIPEKQQLSPQAWRRTHIDWLIAVGYRQARHIGQSAADHGDAKTTEGFYVDIKNKCRPRLRWLRPELKPPKGSKPMPPVDPRQRPLFD